MNTKEKFKIKNYKYPSVDKISGRTSTICRSMACTLLKRDGCRPEEETIWSKYFNDTCAYCGKKASHLDHLHALIIDRKPTGYGTEPANLVPCCRECNQPKGNMEWEEFMNSPKCLHVSDGVSSDVEESKQRRINNIKSFEKNMPAHRVVLDEVTIRQWEKLLANFDKQLNDAQVILEELKKKLYK